MIPIKTITDTANTIINTGNLTPNQYAQLSGASISLSNTTPKVAASISALPAASGNKGLLFYVTAVQEYYFSDGTTWRNDFTSDVEVMNVIAYAWGRNTGQLGDNTTSNRSSPVVVVGGITNWTQIASGGQHNLGLTSTGIAYAWGQNSYGRLGDNSTTTRSSPVTVVGGITNWSQLAAGGSHSLGVTGAGIAYAWGRNFTGQLGDNTTSNRSSPVTVVGGITNWSQIAAGYAQSLGLTSAGVAYAWGYNTVGTLGDNTTTSRSSPVAVVGGITNWRQLSAGDSHCMGLTSAGILYGWGRNSSGMLGDNSSTDRSSPVTVVGGITTWSQVAASSHTLGVTSTGILYAWGQNNFGQLGDNSTTSRSSPVTPIGGITNWSQIANGGLHSLGATSAGTAYAWGYNSYGRLGDNSTTNRSSPVIVVGATTNWTQLRGGGNHSLGLRVFVTITKGF